MTDPFSNPASGRFEAKAHNGKLLLIQPLEYLAAVPTVNGPKDCVDGKVVVIDEANPAGSEVIEGARIFGGQLIAATKPFVNKGMVFGRLGQGTAKPGQNAPWVLTDATDAEKDKARAYLASVAPQL